MGGEYNEKMCDERHREISENFKILFKKFDFLTMFVGLFALVGTVLGIVQAIAK